MYSFLLIPLLFTLIHSATLFPTNWASADAIECKPRTDGSPYCQPKSYQPSRTIQQSSLPLILPAPQLPKCAQSNCEINKCVQKPISSIQIISSQPSIPCSQPNIGIINYDVSQISQNGNTFLYNPSQSKNNQQPSSSYNIPFTEIINQNNNSNQLLPNYTSINTSTQNISTLPMFPNTTNQIPNTSFIIPTNNQNTTNNNVSITNVNTTNMTNNNNNISNNSNNNNSNNIVILPNNNTIILPNNNTTTLPNNNTIQIDHVSVAPITMQQQFSNTSIPLQNITILIPNNTNTTNGTTNGMANVTMNTSVNGFNNFIYTQLLNTTNNTNTNTNNNNNNNTNANTSLDINAPINLSSISVMLAPITLQDQITTPQNNAFQLNATIPNIDQQLPNPVAVNFSSIIPPILNQNITTNNPIIFSGAASSSSTLGVNVQSIYPIDVSTLTRNLSSTPIISLGNQSQGMSIAFNASTIPSPLNLNPLIVNSNNGYAPSFVMRAPTNQPLNLTLNNH